MSFLLVGLISITVQTVEYALYLVYTIISFLSYFFVSKMSQHEKISNNVNKIETSLLLSYPLFVAAFIHSLPIKSVLYTLICIILPILVCKLFDLCKPDDKDDDSNKGTPVVERKKRFSFKKKPEEESVVEQQPAYLNTETNPN